MSYATASGYASASRCVAARRPAIALQLSAALLVAIFASACSPSVHAAESGGQAGKGSLQSQIEKHTSSINADKKNALNYHFRAETYALMGENAQALADHNKSLSLEPNSIRYLIARGDFYETVADFDSAIKDYLKALSRKPSKAEDYYWQAEVLKNLQHYNQAIEYCEKAIARGFKTHRVYRLRGRCYYKMDKPREALIDYRKALSMVRVPATYLSIARCLRRTANYDECLKTLDEAKKLAPNYRDIYYEAALTNLLMNKRDKAKQNYDIWLRSLPKAPELSTWESFVRLGEIERKLEEYGRMLALSQTSNADIFYDRAILYMEEGEYHSAAGEMERYLEVTGWSGKSGIMGACYAYMAYRLCGRNARARSVQLDAFNTIRRNDWPFPILQFLADRLSIEKLDSLARDKQKKTEAYFFEALSDRWQNKPHEASRKLKWIIANGDKSLDEHALAIAEQRRIAHRTRIEFGNKTVK